MCQKIERQNISLAAQLLSHTIATAQICYKPGIDKALAQCTDEFIELISNWYDIMNLYTPEAKVPSKRPYGSNLKVQGKVLDSMYEKILTMRCVKKNSSFQKGILLSIKSLKGLFSKLEEKRDQIQSDSSPKSRYAGKLFLSNSYKRRLIRPSNATTRFTEYG